MGIKGMDVEKLVKLMNLTFSSNDHEALSALRKCNQVLSDHKLLWSDFFETLLKFNPAPTPSPPPSKPKEPEPVDDDLAEHFDELIPHLKGKQLEFILGLQEWFEDHGSLTPKQEQAFYSVYERHC
jgi:hypothetical protein